MTKIGISAGFEKRLRVGADPGLLLKELLGLLDSAHAVAAAPKKSAGVGYKELVGLFRAALGPKLAVAPNPASLYIIRLVNRARDLGLNAEAITAACAGAQRLYPSRTTYDLEFLVNQATNLIAAAETIGDGWPNRGATVYHGRPEADGDD